MPVKPNNVTYTADCECGALVALTVAQVEGAHRAGLPEVRKPIEASEKELQRSMREAEREDREFRRTKNRDLK